MKMPDDLTQAIMDLIDRANGYEQLAQALCWWAELASIDVARGTYQQLLSWHTGTPEEAVLQAACDKSELLAVAGEMAVSMAVSR